MRKPKNSSEVVGLVSLFVPALSIGMIIISALIHSLLGISAIVVVLYILGGLLLIGGFIVLAIAIMDEVDYSFLMESEPKEK